MTNDSKEGEAEGPVVVFYYYIIMITFFFIEMLTKVSKNVNNK